MNRSLLMLLVAVAGGVALAGCVLPAAEYRRYETFTFKVAQDTGIEKFKPSQLSEIDDLLAAFYGTPDEPAIPAVEDADIASIFEPAAVADGGRTRGQRRAGPSARAVS